MGQIANAASSSFDAESFTTPAGGGGGSVQLQSQHEPTVTYQWQRSDDGGNSWVVYLEQHHPYIQLQV